VKKMRRVSRIDMVGVDGMQVNSLVWLYGVSHLDRIHV